MREEKLMSRMRLSPVHHQKGELVEREPPTGSPTWALSDEWREIMQRREQEQTEM